ncbi:aromatic aminotransferase ISS1 isoform X3 [Rosa chinensis]|uniref:aromatic aminotransferase ISS1 isoform X3 n=1 Tax=Rosa chinensis TaxID=74649 RepID=UPI001AD8FED6|nr:aromatic aminotransferase ISS1 isoform X3 [Rosa chinensis]
MGSHLKLAKRAMDTEMPVMVQIQQLIRGAKNAVSLAQGVVHWQPPKQALDKVKELVWEPSISRYGADEGMPELREALVKKVARGKQVMQIFGYGYCRGKSDWLEKTLSETKPTPKLVTVVNPGNPSGTYIPEPLLKRISDICREAGSWLVVDNTYEYFMYDDLKHSCVEGNHIVNIFSFSKAYGMMGWRVGYIAYPSEVEGFGTQLLKVQDNIPICASILSQHLALCSLEMGPEWVVERVKGLVKNREIVLEALSPLGKQSVKGGEGAIYLWAKLPDKYVNDSEIVHWLAHRHGVVVIPGSACGCPGNLRISFGGLLEDDCKAAAERLRRGLEELVKDGMVN